MRNNSRILILLKKNNFINLNLTSCLKPIKSEIKKYKLQKSQKDYQKISKGYDSKLSKKNNKLYGSRIKI